MSVRIYTADLTNIETPEALQVYLGYVLGAPEWYGRNLDALYDVLTETARPTRLRVLPPARPNAAMAAYMRRLARVLRDAAEACPAFSFELDEKAEDGAHAGF